MATSSAASTGCRRYLKVSQLLERHPGISARRIYRLIQESEPVYLGSKVVHEGNGFRKVWRRFSESGDVFVDELAFFAWLDEVNGVIADGVFDGGSDAEGVLIESAEAA